jgi:CheY-like chemotaxis protein
MAKVLIVEDEPVLRSSMARGIAKLPGITVAEAGTVQAALESVDAAPPQMIISDIDLPDRSGLELLGELGRRGARVPVLFVSAYLKAYGAQIPPHADVDVREKPVELDELRALVQARVTEGPHPAEEAPFGPADYLQIACLGHRSVVIEVESGTEEGAIVVQSGTLWTAHDAHGDGDAAFRRLCFLPHAVVRVRTPREDAGPRTIHDGWEQLLLDAARRHDEEVHSTSSAGLEGLFVEGEEEPTARPPAPTLPSEMEVRDAVAEVRSIPPPAPDFDALFDAGVTALLGKDYAAAYAAFEQAAAIRPDDAKTQTNLARLRHLGHGAAPGEDA